MRSNLRLSSTKDNASPTNRWVSEKENKMFLFNPAASLSYSVVYDSTSVKTACDNTIIHCFTADRTTITMTSSSPYYSVYSHAKRAFAFIKCLWDFLLLINLI